MTQGLGLGKGRSRAGTPVDPSRGTREAPEPTERSTSRVRYCSQRDIWICITPVDGFHLEDRVQAGEGSLYSRQTWVHCKRLQEDQNGQVRCVADRVRFLLEALGAGDVPRNETRKDGQTGLRSLGKRLRLDPTGEENPTAQPDDPRCLSRQTRRTCGIGAMLTRKCECCPWSTIAKGSPSGVARRGVRGRCARV